VAAPSTRASLGRRTVCGRTEQRMPPVSKRRETKVRMVWGSFLIAAAALKTPTKNGYNSQGVNLTFCLNFSYHALMRLSDEGGQVRHSRKPQPKLANSVEHSMIFDRVCSLRLCLLIGRFFYRGCSKRFFFFFNCVPYLYH